MNYNLVLFYTWGYAYMAGVIYVANKYLLTN